MVGNVVGGLWQQWWCMDAGDGGVWVVAIVVDGGEGAVWRQLWRVARR